MAAHRFVSGFIRHFEDNYIKFEHALRSTLRIPKKVSAPRKAKTKSVLESFLQVQTKTLKKKAMKSKKAVKWDTMMQMAFSIRQVGWTIHLGLQLKEVITRIACKCPYHMHLHHNCNREIHIMHTCSATDGVHQVTVLVELSVVVERSKVENCC